MKKTRLQCEHESGFTLVVIAALFIAFAVIGAAALERNSTMDFINKRNATQLQLTKLANAIIEYSVFNKSGNTNLYPCPALPTLQSDVSALFGVQIANESAGAPYARSCSDTTGDDVGAGLTSDGAGNQLRIIGGAANEVIIGMVPVATLSSYGISSNDAFDAWNNRIMYVVNRKMAYGGTPSQAQNPTITDQRTGFTIAAPDFILISYGRDGLGAYNRSGSGTGGIAIPCTTPGTVLRHENCDRDTVFYIAPTNTSSKATSATYFDDIMTWYRQ